MTDYLERITIQFPNRHADFTHQLAALLGPLGQIEGQLLNLTASNQEYFPKVHLDLQSSSPDVRVEFALSDGESLSVTVENTTGESRQSPHSYALVTIEDVRQRFADAEMNFIGCDHVGFNLPWFSSGVHPRIRALRKALAPRCLYHTFPSGEPWDFILPGNVEEISGRKGVDYTKVRKPKFEIVSFEKCSTPLIQLDVAVNGSFEDFTRLFPEALVDPQFHNMWLYLQNPCSIDVCLVINQFAEGDWSGFFDGHRL